MENSCAATRGRNCIQRSTEATGITVIGCLCDVPSTHPMFAWAYSVWPVGLLVLLIPSDCPNEEVSHSARDTLLGQWSPVCLLHLSWITLALEVRGRPPEGRFQGR